MTSSSSRSAGGWTTTTVDELWLPSFWRIRPSYNDPRRRHYYSTTLASRRTLLFVGGVTPSNQYWNNYHPRQQCRSYCATTPCWKKKSGGSHKTNKKPKKGSKKPKLSGLSGTGNDQEQKKNHNDNLDDAVREWNERGRFAVDTTKSSSSDSAIPWASIQVETGPPGQFAPEDTLERFAQLEHYLDHLVQKYVTSDPARDWLRAELALVLHNDPENNGNHTNNPPPQLTYAETKRTLTRLMAFDAAGRQQHSLFATDEQRTWLQQRLTEDGQEDKSTEQLLDDISTHLPTDVAPQLQHYLQQTAHNMEHDETRVELVKLEALPRAARRQYTIMKRNVFFETAPVTSWPCQGDALGGKLRLEPTEYAGHAVNVTELELPQPPGQHGNTENNNHQLRKGRIILFVLAWMGECQFAVKQITGLPGDVVHDMAGQLCRVPAHTVWVQGDPGHHDSRVCGPIPVSNVRLVLEDPPRIVNEMPV